MQGSAQSSENPSHHGWSLWDLAEGIPSPGLCGVLDSVRFRSLVVPCPQQDFLCGIFVFAQGFHCRRNITGDSFVD